MQHDCSSSGCTSLAQVHVRQENAETRKTRAVVDHVATDSYVLNTFSLHNHQLIASAIPTPLLTRRPVVTAVQQVREYAAKLIRQKKTQSVATVESGVLPDPSIRIAATDVHSNEMESGERCHTIQYDTGSTFDEHGGAAVQGGNEINDPVAASTGSFSTPIFEHAKKKPGKRKGATKEKAVTKRRKAGVESVQQPQVRSCQNLVHCLLISHP